MKQYEPYKNINIKVPTELINKIKIIAIQKDVYAKDLILDILYKVIEKEKIELPHVKN
jgi:hypothetical protein